ncbi:hypothetical protein DFH11DRAFT_552243 [Phellopilus nigrolimitatus]|nr:hypothetical protein DFH11DRAFT_552243 [Phellopilus nigrolimitatus]
MPRLRHMRSHNHLPKPLLGKQCITTFAFTQEIDRMGQCSIPSLLPILETYENLQDLSLNVAGYEYNPRSRDVIVELPHLESLSLELHLKGAIISLMPSLVLPKLRRLTFEVDDEDDETSPLSEWLQLLLGCGYPSLKELMVKDSYSGGHEDASSENSENSFSEDTDLYLDELLWKTPKLQSLSIESTRRCIPLLTEDANLPPLRVLRLKNNVELSSSFVTLFKKRLVKEGKWDGFEKLEIIGCSGMKKEEVEKKVSKAKLTWL